MIIFFVAFVLGEAVASVSDSAGFLCMVIISIGIFFSRTVKKHFPVLLKMFLFICLWCGFFRMGGESKELPKAFAIAEQKEADIPILGEVTSISYQNEKWVLMTKNNIMIYEGGQYQLPYLLTYLKEEIFPENPYGIKIGMKVQLKGKLGSFSTPRNPGEFNYQSYYQAIKVRKRLFADEIFIADDRYSPYYEGCRKLRDYCGNILDTICQKEDSGLLKAVLLGDKADLDLGLRQLYQRNGIAHLLAISGLHISMIGMGIYRFLRWRGVNYQWAGLVSGFLVISYGVLTGFGASAARAVIMIVCRFLAEYLGRTYDILSALSLAGIMLLWDGPYLLKQSGFQLSFGAVLAIAGPGQAAAKWLGNQGQFLDGLAVSLMIQLITYPIILYHFFQFPIYGIFLNLLVLPLMGILVGSGILGIAAGGILIEAGAAAVGAAHYILVFYRKVCLIFENLPGYSIIVGRPAMWQIVFYYALVSAFLLLISRKTGVKHVESCKKRWGMSRRWSIYLCVCVFCFFLLFQPSVKDLEITFLDVGQGDGIFVQTKECRILVDGGSSQVKELGRYRIEPFLKSKGVSRIDYAFISHGDKDHTSGVEYLLKECKDISIDNLVLPCLGKGEEVYNRLEHLALARGGKVWYIKQGDQLTAGKLTITCLFPNENFLASNRNEQSEVLSVTYGKSKSEQGFHMLLTGDVEQGGEAQMVKDQVLHKVHILKAAHHGSETSSTEAFLDTVLPRWCILSYGTDNSYGHPHKQVTDRLTDRGILIWETAKSGAIQVKTDGRKIKINGYVKNSCISQEK